MLAAGGTQQILIGGNEPDVAVDPNNPLNVVVADFRSLRISTDGGINFGATITVNAPNGYGGFGGDPSVNFDRNGNIYFSYLASVPAQNRAAVFNAVLDLNGNILQNVLVADVTDTHTHDKEWVAADKWVNSPFRDNAYIVWTQLGDGSPVLFSRTTDGGVNWSAPITISNNGDDGFKWPSEVAVARNGDVWVAYHTHSDEGNAALGGVKLRKSSDGGQTFAPEIAAFTDGTASITDNDTSAGHAMIPRVRSWTLGAMQPRVLLDPVRPNNLYIISVDDADNDFTNADGSDIVMARSTDYGVTWTRSTISHAPAGTQQLYPSAYIDEEGRFLVAWYDTRGGQPSVGVDQVPGNGDDNLLMDVYATVSLDGGATFSQDFRVNETSFDPDLGPPTDRFPPNNVFRIGEYHGNEAASSYAYIAWTTNQTTLEDNIQSIAFDVVCIESANSDRFESNNTRATATNLGQPEFVTLDELTIDPGDSAADGDFYKINALFTGTLEVGIDFLNRSGDLDLQIVDASGDVVATSASSTADGERVSIPVVASQTYFIHVSAKNGNTNCYSLQTANHAAPIPAAPQLDPAFDSGMMNNDGVTFFTGPTYYVSVDLASFVDTNADGALANNDQEPTVLTAAQAAAFNVAGLAVQVFWTSVNNPANNVRAFATAVDPANPTLFRVSLPAGTLAADEYLVTAAVRAIDNKAPRVSGLGERSPAAHLIVDQSLPALSVFSIPDLLSSSDSGMFADDNVTNKMSPAFDGLGEAGAKVRLRANNRLVGSSVVNSDASDGVLGNGLGTWEITSEPLTDGKYTITAEYEDAAGNIVSSTQVIINDVPAPQLMIEIDTLAPNTPYLDLLVGSDTGRSNADNVTRANDLAMSATTEDPNDAAHLFARNLKYRIFDRLGTAAESKVFDSFATVGDLVTQSGADNPQLPILAAAPEGDHNYKLEVEDRAGNISDDFLLRVIVDRTAPPNPTLFIDPVTTDTGVAGHPATFNDRITNDTPTAFTGAAEADSIVRVWADGAPISAGQVVAGDDVFEGLTVAVPLDGNQAFPNGAWRLTPRFDLNNPAFFPFDGQREINATAEDVAGNESSRNEPAVLKLFVDTQGPQVTNVYITSAAGFNLFAVKPNDSSPTPLVSSLSIDLIDNPLRTADFAYPPFLSDMLVNHGHYRLVGDHVGVVSIRSITATQTGNAGETGRATVTLHFSAPLEDDRYTLRLLDELVDVAGNRLDGESEATEPPVNAPFRPLFPSGNLVPGGDYSARFTVDTRPEIGDYAAASVYIDINGNGIWDPHGAANDQTNRDLVFSLQIAPALFGTIGQMGVHDAVFAGNFSRNVFDDGEVGIEDGVAAPPAAADGFDKLASYGFDSIVQAFRWLIDLNRDGVIDTAAGDIVSVQPAGFQINGLPVAGNFDGNAADGDEIGLFDGKTWWLDKNHDYVINAADVGLGGQITTNHAGAPIVGDFDGNGVDDFGVWRVDTFTFDMNLGVGPVRTLHFGYPGVEEKPIAADMDKDGVDDVGLFTPRRAGTTVEQDAEWYFLVSNHFTTNQAGDVVPANHAALHNTVSALDHPFAPTPLGHDLFYQFGDEFALPIVGNFDPPVSLSPGGNSLDVNGDGRVTPLDVLQIIDCINSGHGGAASLATQPMDVNRDGTITPRDVLQVIDSLNRPAASANLAAAPLAAAAPVPVALSATTTVQASDAAFAAWDAGEADISDDAVALLVAAKGANQGPQFSTFGSEADDEQDEPLGEIFA